MKKVNIYTDGACKGNPGRGGWGTILVYGVHEKEMSGGEVMTTNNRMELMAVISGLEALREPCEVTLTSDSTYVINSITKKWLDGWAKKNWIKSGNTPVPNAECRSVEAADRGNGTAQDRVGLGARSQRSSVQ